MLNVLTSESIDGCLDSKTSINLSNANSPAYYSCNAVAWAISRAASIHIVGNKHDKTDGIAQLYGGSRFKNTLPKETFTRSGSNRLSISLYRFYKCISK